VVQDGIWFNPDRGRTGGEDGEFFSRQLNNGKSFVWCDEAVVYEIVSEERLRLIFHLKKYLRIGTIAGEQHRRDKQIAPAVKSLLKCCCYIGLLPFFAVAGRARAMRLLMKLAYDFGCITAYCGLSLQRVRPEFVN
jgi:hypothetical protein